MLGMDDMPLVSQLVVEICESKNLMHLQGFGVTARSTAEVRRLEPTGIVCFRQADVGEYLREVSPQGEIRVESAADWSIGGYSFYNDVASSWELDMQHEGNRSADMAASKDLQVCGCVFPSVEDEGNPTKIERAEELPVNPPLRNWMGDMNIEPGEAHQTWKAARVSKYMHRLA